MMTIYNNDYPRIEWEALYDSSDGTTLAGCAFDLLVDAFKAEMDRECADESRHERGLRVPADHVYGSRG